MYLIYFHRDIFSDIVSYNLSLGKKKVFFQQKNDAKHVNWSYQSGIFITKRGFEVYDFMMKFAWIMVK